MVDGMRDDGRWTMDDGTCSIFRRFFVAVWVVEAKRQVELVLVDATHLLTVLSSSWDKQS